MSCADCCFPYSLCQCPATITMGELAQLRVDLAEMAALLRLSGSVQRDMPEFINRVEAVLVRAPAPPVNEYERRAEVLLGGAALAVFCGFEDCDREPDSSGFCDHHRCAVKP